MVDRVPAMISRRGTTGYLGEVTTYDPRVAPAAQVAGPAWHSTGFDSDADVESHAANASDPHAAAGYDTVADRETAVALMQTLHANLTALAGLSLIADRLAYANGTGTLALTTLTAAGRALLDDADAAAQLTTLGLSTFVKTLVDDADAAAFFTTLGISAFVQTILNDADGPAALTTLGISAFAQTVLDDADAGAVRTTLGAGTYSKPSTPEVPASPTEQNIVDALVTLGLVTQAA